MAGLFLNPVKKPTWRLHGPNRLADILTSGGDDDGQVPLCAGDVLGRGWTLDFPRARLKRVRLTKKTLRPVACAMFRGSQQPIPGHVIHNILMDGDPMPWRSVARIIRGESSPGDRLDGARIG